MMTKVPLSTGSNPNTDTRVDNPRLRNWFVGEKAIHRLPSLAELTLLSDCRAIHETTFDSGSYIVVTKGQVVRVQFRGSIEHISNINNSDGAVRISENQANEVTIVNGSSAYVYKQSTAEFTQLTTTHGFDLINPVDTVVLDTFTIIVGGSDKKWTVSSPNNALTYNTSDVQVTDDDMGNLVGVAELDNNIFIFGGGGVQRWVPSIARTTYDFPFDIDPSFRAAYGCLSTGSIVSETSVVYFLAENHVVQSLSAQGLTPISAPGMSKEISRYAETNFSNGSMLEFQGRYFYQLSFDENSWVFAEDTNKWSESDDMIIDSVGDTIVTSEGVFTLTDMHTSKACEYVSVVTRPSESTAPYRRVLNSVKLGLIQGLSQVDEPQHVELAVSQDNIRWSNNVKREIGLTGDRQANNVWRMNLSAQQFTFRIRYYGSLDLTLESLTIDIK